MRWRIGLVLLLGSAPLRAFGQSAEVGIEVPQPVPNISSELLDPQGLSRFHLVSRAAFSDSNALTAKVQTWSWEARANIRIVRGISLAAVAPFGLLVPGPGQVNKFFFGNLSVGVAGGGQLLLGGADQPAIAIGGGLDIYAPTAPQAERAQEDPALTGAELAVASMRSYEPQLYLPNLMSFRTRALGRLRIAFFTAELELGLTPGFTLDSRSEFIMFLSSALRTAVQPIREIEPYLELGGALQVAGDKIVRPPFLITPGVRFHLFDTIDPALFLSFNFVHGSAIIFGVDIAGALRPAIGGHDEIEDFFSGFD